MPDDRGGRDDPATMADDFPILAAVAAAEAHPYRLLEHLNALGIHTARSTLYRRVDALIADGFLTSHAGEGKNGRERRDLSLTERGRRRLADAATAVIRREPLESPRFALALACARILDTASLPGVLRMRMATAARRLTAEEQELNAIDAREAFWDRASHERRVAHLKADLQWLQAVLARNAAGAVTGAGDEGGGTAGLAATG